MDGNGHHRRAFKLVPVPANLSEFTLWVMAEQAGDGGVAECDNHFGCTISIWALR